MDIEWESVQSVLDASLSACPAKHYWSDGYEAYPALAYQVGEQHTCLDKSQTYSVEAGNAELRHYLARLARRSRCFSRCIEALRRAVFLFVHAWNTRQLKKRQFPNLPITVAECLPFLF